MSPSPFCAYFLLFNPLGMQGDGVFTEGQGIDFSVDVVMQSQGRVTDDGYTLDAQDHSAVFTNLEAVAAALVEFFAGESADR